MIRAAATPKRKPSASALAPFSIALCKGGGGGGVKDEYAVSEMNEEGGVPSFGKGPYMLSWFTKQVRSETDFESMHALGKADTDRSERFVSANGDISSDSKLKCRTWWFPNVVRIDNGPGTYCLAWTLIWLLIGFARVSLVLRNSRSGEYRRKVRCSLG